MSRAFSLLLSAREKFYQSGVLRTFRLDHPVISIGNLTVGGTGKTPLVIALAEGLRDEGFRPVVLSRGYRRRSSGVVVVSKGEGPEVPWQDAGDEPFLIAQRTRGISVLVGSDRYLAGRHAESADLGDIFILDDGFQHRRLFRDVDIVTIDPVEWAGREKLLPAGRWREPRSALGRAHVAAVPLNAEVENVPIPLLRVETAVDGIFDGSSQIPPESIREKRIVAFAGIAKPERFFRALERLGLKPAARVRFRDHHAYTRADLAKLDGEVRITTEKDAVRLVDLAGRGFLHLRISAKIHQFDWLMSLIRSRLP